MLHEDIDSLRKIVDASDANDVTDRFTENLRIELMLKQHVSKIITERSIVITGDTNHLSIDFIINTQFRDIDKPRKYDFQEENYHEIEFARSISRALPQMAFSLPFTKEQAEAAIAGTATLVLMKKGYDGHKFYDCGEAIRVSICGNAIHLDCAKECAKNEEYSVEIDCPSGEFVFADWPDRFSEASDAGYITKEDFDINYLYGIRQSSESMAKQGILHMFVGNTCPQLHINPKNNRIRIGGKKPKNYDDAGSFCTDLWWVTMIDKSRYDAIMAKLPKTRDKGYYKKEVNTAKVAPGRYRFTAVKSRDVNRDDYGRLFVKAQRIGDCAPLGAIPEPLSDKRLLTPDEVIAAATHRHKTLYTGETFHVKFRTLDHIFNVLGNGLKSKGDFYTNYAVPADTPVNDAMLPETEGEREPNQKMKLNPYPNYEARYSLLGRGDIIEALTDEWLVAAEWFYDQSIIYFENGAEGYHRGYPITDSARASWVKSLADHRKPEWTDEEYYASVTKNWESPYNGDLDAFLITKWEKEKAKIIAFCKKMCDDIGSELDRRGVE